LDGRLLAKRYLKRIDLPPRYQLTLAHIALEDMSWFGMYPQAQFTVVTLENWQALLMPTHSDTPIR